MPLSCKAQHSEFPCKSENVTSSIWIPQTDIYQKIDFNNELLLVFQSDFNDSLRIFLDDQLLVNDHFKTDPNLTVVPKFTKIDAKKLQDGSLLKIVSNEKQECINIPVKYGYRYAYISKNQNEDWFIEYSNYKRKYY